MSYKANEVLHVIGPLNAETTLTNKQVQETAYTMGGPEGIQ